MDIYNLYNLIPSIQVIMLYADIFNLEEFKVWREELQADFVRYEALGFTDGHAYYKKLNTKRALLQRMDAVYNLAKVVQDTKDLIDMDTIKPAEDCWKCGGEGDRDD